MAEDAPRLHQDFDFNGQFVTVESFIASMRSDFFPCFSFPDEDSDCGYYWFSCLRKSWRSPSLDWLAMYIRENKAQSLFSSVIFCLTFDGGVWISSFIWSEGTTHNMFMNVWALLTKVGHVPYAYRDPTGIVDMVQCKEPRDQLKPAKLSTVLQNWNIGWVLLICSHHSVKLSSETGTSSAAAIIMTYLSSL